MKISFLLPNLGLYGGTRRIIELSNHLVDRSYEVTIFHSNGSRCRWMECKAKIKSQKEVLNEEHDVLINTWALSYPIFRKAKAKLKVFYVLVLYERWLLKGTWLQLLLFTSDVYSRARDKLSKNPLARSIYGHLKNILTKSQSSYNLNGRRGKSLLKSFTSHLTYIRALKKSLHHNCLKLSNSTWMYHWLKEELNINSDLLIGGINEKMFHPIEVIKNPNEVRVLCSGDPRERKGTDIILEAIEIVKKEEPRIVLDTYHGEGIPQEKMVEKYSSADIFVDAQWYAGWNNPVAEAMSCKIPVVCTDIGGVKDFAFHEKTALLVPPKDPEAMASAILRLIRDEKLGETLRENAFNHIRQFDWDKSAERLEEILSSELNRKKKLVSKIPIAAQNLRKVLHKAKAMLKKVFQRKKGFDKYRKLGTYHWNSYKNDPISREHVDYIIDKFKEKPKGSFLDVECGDGLISCLLAEKGFKVKGIDIENEGIRLAQRKCSSAVFEVKDVFDINEVFDYLLASEVIEHLSNPDEFLQKIKGLFRKEALITTPKRDYYKQLDPYHFREYSIFECESLLEKHFKSFKVQASEYHLYAEVKNER